MGFVYRREGAGESTGKSGITKKKVPLRTQRMVKKSDDLALTFRF